MTTTFDRDDPFRLLQQKYDFITDMYVQKLFDAGFKTIGDVARIMSPVPIARRLGIIMRDVVRLVHISQMESQFVVRYRPLRLPGGNPIWFDIETDTHWHRIWMIGAYDEKEDRVTQFFADDWNCERQILEDFHTYLNDRPNRPLIYYSCNGFDVRKVKKAAIRHGMLGHAIFSRREQDLCYPIRASYYIPQMNRKLKTIARFLGYDMTLEGREDYMDGKECAMHYESYVMLGTPLDKNIFQYNANDVMMLPFIVNKLDKVAIDLNEV